MISEKQIKFSSNLHDEAATNTNAIIYDHYLVTISCLVI
jgi:hypothetical protein